MWITTMMDPIKNLTDRYGYEPNLFYMLNFNQPLLRLLIRSTTGVTYPYQTCTGCTIGSFATSLSPAHIIIPSANTPINESPAQSLNFSGDGDAGD
jgi:hypothetical protein